MEEDDGMQMTLHGVDGGPHWLDVICTSADLE